ncbi:exodeoxyribonuclease V subunit beta [Motilimonas pumila]|uniref:RecBCD enzyme subunit RecB n=1 Tax=Motilimonas pumila TaxID=2303987 RepID=A0A418YAD4_9GAMM|nr:exodeoxyribonuclease V subunit beta [Motilimonas pumila]RJG39484.1 exodeoxyribonuclease V subunit beta [Motilimonas pumila]
MAQQLQPLTFPLHGQRLIEASAGTGKTYTIASLVLRLLLGHGGEGVKRETPVSIDQILVVTFTEAATAELRDRIRKRIKLQKQYFKLGEADSNDPVAVALLNDISDHEWAQQVLQSAERQMDEAAVFTIHGFCQRMLKQHAFESGSLFEAELVQEQGAMIQQAVNDYWRIHFYPLPPAETQAVYEIWSEPQQLQQDLHALLHQSEVDILPAVKEFDLSAAFQANLNNIEQFKQQWREVADDIMMIIGQSDVSKRSYSKKNLPAWFHQVNNWAQQDVTSCQLPDKLDKFSQTALFDKTPKGEAPQHHVFEQVDDLLASDLSLKEPLLVHAMSWVKQRLTKHKRQTNELNFDDLLVNLDLALQSEQGQQLQQSIVSAFPVAMIDEFQDTDPVQYRIFTYLYGQQSSAGLFMIGDPKQAIYGFRGADIFTYIHARRSVLDHYTLDNNYRSTAAMINGVNQIFAQAPAPFIYEHDIAFMPVNFPQGKAEKTWCLLDTPQAAVNVWLAEPESGTQNKNDYLQTMALTCANQINRILTGSDSGHCFMQVKGRAQPTPIKAGSIAVLVRTGTEATRIKAALSQQGIKSVYLSNRESVFGCQQAVDLYRILAAVLTPSDDRLLRAMLACELFNFSLLELDEFCQDEQRWEALIAEFVEYRQLWLQQGILPMLRQLFSQRGICARLMSGLEGERTLTDLLHLGELLQQASAEQDGPFALLRWFLEHINHANGHDDEQQLRLESDQDLVQIVTIHKSKGLEYDFVFLPFICSFRAASTALFHHPESGLATLDLFKEPQHLELADTERLAEDLRLLYVALTRSVFACYLGVSPLKARAGKSVTTDLHRSALGYLLQHGQEQDLPQLKQALQSLTEKCADIALWPVDTQAEPRYQALAKQQQRVAPLDLNHEIERNWWVTSYSSLSRGHGEASLAQKEDVEVAVEQLDEPGKSVFTFHKGARAGTFLHTLFEQFDFTQTSTEYLAPIIAEQLENEGYEADWLPVLTPWIQQVLQQNLGQGFALEHIKPAQCLIEMEFFLPMASINAADVNALLQGYDDLSKVAGALNFATVQGMLKGFIDLTFEHQGKYYVLDYKSNYLGDTLQDYNTENMQRAMIEHRYDFQYQLYSLALHRFLQQRLPNYDYQQHFGGVYYLFLRGMQGEQQGVFYHRPALSFIEQLDQVFRGEHLSEPVQGVLC